VMFNSIGDRLKPEGKVAGMDADEHMKPVDADDAGEDTGEPLLIGIAPLEQQSDAGGPHCHHSYRT
jgi:hypothetical protein